MIKFTEQRNNEDGTTFKVMEIPILDELKQDCYRYDTIDAPTEIKMLILEHVAIAFDKYIIENAPEYVDKKWLENKLNQVKIQ
jgi:hypothetical protein